MSYKQSVPTTTSPVDPHNEVFAKEGFTPDLCKSFQFAADDLEMAILSRVPGGSCTDLIAAGQDLKGYFIKAKSCDFGPMAGFLCQLPLFNKNGADGMEFNARENDKTVRKYDRVQKFIKAKNAPPNDEEEKQLAHCDIPKGWEKQMSNDINFNFGNAILPFCRIKISAQRADAIQDEAKRTTFGVVFTEKLGDGSIYGIAHNKGQRVYVEFLLRPDSTGAEPKTDAKQPAQQAPKPTLYSVYHGDIFYQPNEKDSTFFSFLGGINMGLFPYAMPTDKEANRDTLYKILQQMKLDGDIKEFDTSKIVGKPALKVSFTAVLKKFYPVLGIKNHYPPYDDKGARNASGRDSNHYKNAVTGDYDLFAVWPMKREKLDPKKGNPDRTQAGEIVRVSEKGTKRFAVRQNEVVVDIIPSYAELEEPKSGMDEDPRLGNITNNVATAAQMLNAHATRIAGGGNDTNKAFHSDEGGRPGMQSVDLPTAIFVPCKANGSGNGTQVPRLLANYQRDMLTSKLQFLETVLELKKDYQVQIQLGWLYDLLQESLPPKKKAETAAEKEQERTKDAVYKLVKEVFALDTRPAGAAAAEAAAASIRELEVCTKGSGRKDKDPQLTSHDKVVSKVKEVLAKLTIAPPAAPAKAPAPAK